MRMKMMMGECIPFTLYTSLGSSRPTMLAELLGGDGTEPGQEGTLKGPELHLVSCFIIKIFSRRETGVAYPTLDHSSKARYSRQSVH